MFKKIYIFCIITVTVFTTLDLNSKEGFQIHVDNDYKYSIMIPGNWEKKTLDLEYKRVIILNDGRNTEIKITVSGIENRSFDKWDNWREWYIKGIGSNLRVILEKKRLNPDTNIKGKLLVFQYYSNGIKYLQRVLVNRFKKNQLVIECKSPVRTFYYYDKTFNIVMNSLQLNE